MNNDLKTLQLFYAGALVDAVYSYGRNNVLEKVTEEKKVRQEMAAAGQLKHLEIEKPQQLYRRFTEIFGCVPWAISEDGEDITAESKSCMMCAIAKKQGAPKPCELFCINPFKAYAKELGYELEVKETLWEGERCVFLNKKKG